jgi:hypothetical protein
MSENYRIKFLVEKDGAILCFVHQPNSYMVFLTPRFFGVRQIRTDDRIVAKLGYSVARCIAWFRDRPFYAS